MKAVREWFANLFLPQSPEKKYTGTTEPHNGVSPGVPENGSMYIHYVKSVDVEYRTRGHMEHGTATICIKDRNGYTFDINLFSSNEAHIEVETHDANR